MLIFNAFFISRSCDPLFNGALADYFACAKNKQNAQNSFLVVADPAGHDVHEMVPLLLEYLPAGHARHVVPPSDDENEPGGQAVQATVPFPAE